MSWFSLLWAPNGRPISNTVTHEKLSHSNIEQSSVRASPHQKMSECIGSVRGESQRGVIVSGLRSAGTLLTPDLSEVQVVMVVENILFMAVSRDNNMR